MNRCFHKRKYICQLKYEFFVAISMLLQKSFDSTWQEIHEVEALKPFSTCTSTVRSKIVSSVSCARKKIGDCHILTY